jgi:hypothetical protein
MLRREDLPIVALNKVRLPMKILSLVLPLIIFIQTSSITLGLSAATQNNSNETAASSAWKRFNTHFISLKRGHTIASSSFTFGDGERFEIKTPGEDFLQTKGSHTKNGMFFEAYFEATILKQKKHYRYTFSIKGISLLDNYIAGVVVLNESIKETDQKQEVSFLFLGMPEDAIVPEKDKKSLFPF